MATHDFEGRVALVTGGGSGIGRATCCLLARDGARVVVADINLRAAEETLNLLHRPEDHLALALDVRDKSSAVAAVRAAREKLGSTPSLLVNSAGVITMCEFLAVDEDAWANTIDINLKGTFLVSQAVTKALLEEEEAREVRAGAAVVNVASISGKTGFPGVSPYAASKGGVLALTKTCAAELAKEGVRVNCVVPGTIETPLVRSVPKEAAPKRMPDIPLGRMGQPEEVAEVVVFLLTPRSSYVVGACVEVTGGCSM